MAFEIIMPKFGFTQETADIVQWIVKEGEYVEKGDPIAEVTTDKVNMEVEAPEDGYLGGVRYQEGETVPVTVVIAYILAEGEQPPAAPPHQMAKPAEEAPAPVAETGGTAKPAAATASASSLPATPVARRMAEVEGVDLNVVPASGDKITREDVTRYLATRGNGGTVEGDGDGDGVRATPAARRVAREHGLDLAAIAGSGPRGRVQEADAEAAASAVAPAAAPTPAAVTYAAPGEAQVIPLEGMRKTIATRLSGSWQAAPHIMFTATIDMTESIALRQAANARLAEGQGKVSMTAVVFKAVAWALRQVPAVNAHFINDQIIILPDVNIGMAVALEDGLIVPVITQVDQKGLIEVGQDVADKANRARNGKLRPADMIDGSFSISNMGMFGVDQFTSIINPPQVGILSVGQTVRAFVPDENDQPVVKPLMKVTLAVDHRVIDGAVAGQFLQCIKDALEQPALMTF